MLIETERLAIRRLGGGDEAFIVELLNQPSFVRNIGDRKVKSIEDAARYIREGPVASYSKFGFGLFHVSLKDGSPIGICGLLKRDALEDVDIGFAYLEAYQGRGYGLEAAEAVMAFGWKSVGLKRIIAITAPHNEGSMRLLGKLGMKFEGMVRLPGAASESKLFGMRLPNDPV
jgi:RimJ/RimL family protein N-acetyltransferase